MTRAIDAADLMWPTNDDITSAEVERAEEQARGRAKLMARLRHEVGIEMARVQRGWNSETWADLSCSASLDRLLHRVHHAEPYVAEQHLERSDAWDVLFAAWAERPCCECLGGGCMTCAGLGRIPSCCCGEHEADHG